MLGVLCTLFSLSLLISEGAAIVWVLVIAWVIVLELGAAGVATVVDSGRMVGLEV